MSDPTITYHRLQTSFEVGPHHWIVARPSSWAGWDVVESTARARRVHCRYRRRAHAEVVAAALAATRIHNLTDEDLR